MARVNKKTGDETPLEAPQTIPTIGLGHPNFNFFQFALEVQKSLGEINSSLITLNKSVESTKTKVDDLVNWKSKILGGAIAIGVVCTLIGFGLSKVSEYVTFKTPVTQVQAVAPAPAQAPLPLEPLAKKRHNPS